MQFALANISRAHKLGHNLIDLPQLSTRPAIHQLTVFENKSNIFHILRNSPLGTI